MELLNKIGSYIEKFFIYLTEYSLFAEEQQKEFNEIVKDVLENEV